MKFGHHLKTSLYPEWTFYYLAYDDLKHELKTRTHGGHWSEDDETSFVELLEKELEKVFTFQTVKSGEINRRIQHSEKVINDVTETKVAKEEDYLEIEEELSNIIADVHDLAKFTRLNYSGFLKIIKKHDENYDALIVKLSRLYDIVRTRGNPVTGNSSAGGQQQNFVRNTTKYWVHPDNITELKLLILKHLPVLVFNPNKEFESADSAISSIYFDNENFDLYLGRLEKSEGAEAIRLRWYGGMDNREIFVERKTHREDWTGEKSVKARFHIKEKYVNRYLHGQYTMDETFNKLKLKGKSDKEIEGLIQLASEVQYSVLTRKLKPAVRTFYNRTAFQLPGDARVRISLDTELSMIREDNFENNSKLRSGDNWRRMDIGIDYPFSQLPDSDIERFPYAILEVKLQTQLGQEPPEWVKELVQSHLVEAVPKFSKFVHGVATLMENRRIQLLPFWLPQMDIDIRKPPSNFRLQRPSASNPTTPAYENGNPLSETEDDNIEVLIEPDSSSHDVRSRNGPQISSLEELEEYLAATTPAGKVPITYQGKRIAIPVRVEPKVYFANERTFLSWLNFTVILGGLAVGLLNFGDKISVTAAAMFTAVAMMVMLYSLGTYLWRAKKIRKKESGSYDDRYGPTFLCGILLIAVVVNFWLRLLEDEDSS
ncbi:6417_t:CDS:2 [Funneliformis geosporum]|uniref:Vacuolar transporter chaperone complex subunit 4 n=1 Tax=Funneliformis geosporum TaxID=1117311 RepID=A0A9W4WTF5_9GLOM|nr:6417_t:CDS:2 [Funneliformis geosporum]